MNNIDINEVDKTHFKCYKFQDGSVYFGEISYLDEEGNVVIDLEKYNDDMIKKLKLVRHGVGVQLFGVTETTSLCRYEGAWIKDKKHGQGICYFPDKSIYDGTFSEDLFDGYGKFSWANNNIYIGEWKNGRMDGEGEFKHHDGHILKGKFRNNYYFDKERFLNPFMSQDELIKFKIKNSDFRAKLRSEYEKFSSANIRKVKNIQDLSHFIANSINENKTPLIIRQSNCILKKEEIVKSLNKEYKEIDLRLISMDLRNSNFAHNIIDKLKQTVEDCMCKGLNLILNFDDCSTKYEELFDPDIEELYGKSMLSPYMWNPNIFSQEKYWHHHLSDKDDLKFDKHFKFIVYSKFVIQDAVKTDEDLLKIIEQRFAKSLPLININVLILSK